MGNRLSANAESGGRFAEPASPDPIFDVAGISSADILRRCDEIRRRGGSGENLAHARVDGHAAPNDWRLLDFADLPDEDFVREAHRVLLARSPSRGEADRRLRELRNRSRMEIVVRLALSPEGRRANRPRVRGVGLPALAATARAIEAAEASPLLGQAARNSERLARSALFEESPKGRSARRLATAAVLTVAAIAVDRRLRHSSTAAGSRPGTRSRL